MAVGGGTAWGRLSDSHGERATGRAGRADGVLVPWLDVKPRDVVVVSAKRADHETPIKIVKEGSALARAATRGFDYEGYV